MNGRSQFRKQITGDRYFERKVFHPHGKHIAPSTRSKELGRHDTVAKHLCKGNLRLSQVWLLQTVTQTAFNR